MPRQAQKSAANLSSLGERFECAFDLSLVTSFMLTDKYQPLIEIELSEDRMCLLDLANRKPIGGDGSSAQCFARALEPLYGFVDIYVGSRDHGWRRLHHGILESGAVSVESRQHRLSRSFLAEPRFPRLSHTLRDQSGNSGLDHPKVVEYFGD